MKHEYANSNLEKPLFGILWDMDGVLFDTNEAHYQSWLEILPAYHISLDRQIFQGIFGMKNEAALARLAGRSLPSDVVAEIEEKKEDAFRRTIRGQMRLFPGVREWLARFREWGYPQAIASSAPPENITVMLAESGIEAYFAAVVSADGLPSKPDPAIYLAAAKRIGMPAERCIVMEDAVWGIAGAKRAGMRCIAVATSNPVEALGEADLVLERLDDLEPEAFRRLVGL